MLDIGRIVDHRFKLSCHNQVTELPMNYHSDSYTDNASAIDEDMNTYSIGILFTNPIDYSKDTYSSSLNKTDNNQNIAALS